MEKLIFVIACALFAYSSAELTVISESAYILQTNNTGNNTICKTYPPISKLTTFILAVIPVTARFGIDRFYSLWINVGLTKLLVGLFCDVCTCGLFTLIFWICDFVSLITGNPIPPYSYQTDGNGCPFKADF